MMRRKLSVCFLSLMLCSLYASLVAAQGPELPENLARRQESAGTKGDDGSSWLLYGRTYKAWRFSSLTQIDQGNVKNLRVAWKLDTGLFDAFKASPVVVDGVMYVSTPWNQVYALNAATGERYWHYPYANPSSLRLCCGAVNRGVAVGSGTVVMANLDATLVGLDAQTGRQVWKTVMADYPPGYSATIAPRSSGKRSSASKTATATR